MFGFYDFLRILAELFGMFGLLVLGAAAGWFTMHTFRRGRVELQIAAFLGFFLLAGIIIFSVPASSMGAFSLGAGTALLFCGLKNDESPEDEAAPEDE